MYCVHSKIIFRQVICENVKKDIMYHSETSSQLTQMMVNQVTSAEKGSKDLQTDTNTNDTPEIFMIKLQQHDDDNNNKNNDNNKTKKKNLLLFINNNKNDTPENWMS